MSACFDEKTYHSLLQSCQAIPWTLDWSTKTFTFTSPQIEERFGWPQENWRSIRDWITLIHPEDRQHTIEYWIQLCQSGVDHELEYRCRMASGKFLWVRDVIHVEQTNGITTSISGLMFDISDKKALEQEMHHLKSKNSALQRTDFLTGLANQNQFDEHLSMEYSRARRNKSSLSLLLLDVDDFVQYYNYHGPLMGDKSLLQIASLIEQNFSRPADKVARLSEGTFAVLLPETEEMTAQLLAESVRQSLYEAQLTHKRSSVSDRVSLSIGCAAFSPQTYFRTLSGFLEKANLNMQRARQLGGNRVFPRPTIYQFLDDQVIENSITKHDRIRRF
ncbi:sensor domain-containing diguanylate cyclase [Vibrio sp. FNV 38]|nr:sensor domain-containing diguanylate cyclase [Vibrio sp. FNV 38]